MTGGTHCVGDGGATGTLGSGDVSVAGGATLALFRNNDFAIANNITGATGLVTQVGTGTTTLSGTNTFGTAAGGGLAINFGGIKVGSAGALTFNQTSRNLTVAARISGTGPLTVNAGTRTLTLSGGNSGLNGLITLNTGTLGIGANAALGNGSILINGGNIRAAGAARNLFNPVTAAGSFIVGRLTDFSGSFTLAANVTITADNFDGLANGDSRFNAGIDGPFAVTFADGPHLIGNGALVVASTNTNGGGTVVASGRVTVEAAGALANAPLTVNNGLLNLNNSVQDVTSFSGTGGVVNLGVGHTLKTTQTVDTAFDGCD